MYASSSVMNKTNVGIEIEPISSTGLIHKSEDVRIPNWRPWTLRLPFFTVALALTLLHSALCALLLVLQFTGSSLLSFSASSVGSYLFWQYVPMILAVAPGLLWEIMYIAVCRLQPFRDLATSRGSTLRDSLSQDYLTSFSWFVPYRALTHTNKHSGVAMISTAYLLSYGALPAASAAMIKISWSSDATQGTAQPLIYFVALALGISVATACFAVSAFVISHRQRTGLFGDPASIAGIGALVAGSDVLAKFQSVRSYDTQARIDQALGSYQLCLEHQSAHQNSWKISLLDPSQHVPEVPETPFRQSETEAHSWWLRGKTYIALTLVQIVPELYIRMASDGSVGANALVVKVCYTVISIISAAIWANWHMNVALLEPFYRLSARKKDALKGSSRALNLDFTGSAISNFFHAMRKDTRSMSVWWISTCAFMIQLSVIINPPLQENRAFIVALLVSNLTDTSDSGEVAIPDGLRVMTYFSYAFVLVELLFVLSGLILVLTRKRKPFLPRKPYTLSSIILYLCHSEGLLEDVGEMSCLPKKARDHRLIRSGNKYGLGWMAKGESGQSFVGIEKLDRIGRPFIFSKRDTTRLPNVR